MPARTPAERLQFSPVLGRLAWKEKRAAGARAPAVVDAFVENGDVVVDVGASWGMYACRLAELVGPDGTVHAFEPNPLERRTLDVLDRAFPQLRLHPTALSEAAGSAELRVPVVDGRPLSALGSLEPVAADGVAFETHVVSVTTLDAALGSEPRVAFVKCDVEGHELAVLRGGSATLGRDLPPLLIEVEHRHSRHGVDPTFDHLARLGYEGWFLAVDRPRPLAEFDLERDQLRFLEPDFGPGGPSEKGYVNNFLFVRPGTDVVARLPSYR